MSIFTFQQAAGSAYVSWIQFGCSGIYPAFYPACLGTIEVLGLDLYEGHIFTQYTVVIG